MTMTVTYNVNSLNNNQQNQQNQNNQVLNCSLCESTSRMSIL